MAGNGHTSIKALLLSISPKAQDWPYPQLRSRGKKVPSVQRGVQGVQMDSVGSVGSVGFSGWGHFAV